jgi:2-succinyl-6-hydroxy-2,4-cyclohexadiene-1-carboxylate synthase
MRYRSRSISSRAVALNKLNLQRREIRIKDSVWSIQMDPDRAGVYPTVIFLHGFLGSGDVFLPLLKHLSMGIHPILVDLPGHGSTTYPNDPKRYQLPQQLNDLHSVIESCTTDPFFLYGYSMGGRLALRYALLFQRSLKGLILESTNHGIQGLGDARERVNIDATRSTEILEDFSTFLTSWNALPMFTGGTPDPFDLKAYYTIQSQQNPVGVANSLIGFGAGLMPDVRARLQQLQLPVLLLAGGYDPAYVRSAGLMKSLIPVSEKVVISTAAHRVHLDAPTQVSAHLSTFIKTYN